ncbi:hypothetical protein PVAG01_06865 [Phlyctema vagabunda]|uniref:Clr5 domain-containing protein n=1 Tax=Phlyctema vagabunda TaxID=108571 RepID=A0ABR4PHC2_9HELO
MDSQNHQELLHPGTAPFFLGIPFERRWESLRLVICNHYLSQQGKTLPDVVHFMKENYHFSAYEHQYKYQLDKWGISKNVSHEIKSAAIVGIGKRSRTSGNDASPLARYRGQDIPKKKLRRHVSEMEKHTAKRERDNPIQLGHNVFIHWNLPYRAFISSAASPDAASSFGVTPAGLSFRSAPSPNNAPTPTALAIRSKTLNERARLFVEGKNEELFKQMAKQERIIVTTWLYHFWLFSFKTAKNWGFGPTKWTVDDLDLELYDEALRHSSPNTPRFLHTPREGFTPGSRFGTSEPRLHIPLVPSSLCRWTIHAAIRNEFLVSDTPDDTDDYHLTVQDGNHRPRWSSQELQRSFVEKLQAALESNTFSTLNIGDLPLAVEKVIKVTRNSARELLQEGFSFTIVARNEELF